jgi:isoquinoline 1-oxidoreductase alpha subunit
MFDWKIKVNGINHHVNAPAKMPLLWVLRDLLNLKGTKFGCGKGLCGSCTIHLDGVAARSCNISIKNASKSAITTIEGLSSKGDHTLQKSWKKYNVPQCGYCQPGQIMNAAAFLNENSNPSMKNIMDSMDGNLCRCGTYDRIKKAIYFSAHKKEFKNEK